MKRLFISVSALLVFISLPSCKQRSKDSQILASPASVQLHGAIVFIGLESQGEFVKNKMLPSLTTSGLDIAELYVNDEGDFIASSKHGTASIAFHDVSDIITNAKWNIALIDSKSVSNNDVSETWAMAKTTAINSAKKNLIPVKIEQVPADKIPLYLRMLTGVDMSGPADAQTRSLERLIKTLKSR